MGCKIAVGGDFYVSKHEIKKIDDKVISSISKVLDGVDFRIINLEAPIVNLSDASNKFGPNLKMPKTIIPIIKRLRIDLLTLANNHILDYGLSGLEETLMNLGEAEIDHIGASSKAFEMNNPNIHKINGMRIGVINVAENEFIQSNGVGANILDFPSNLKTILELKNRTDKIIVIVHGGNETHLYPSLRFKKNLRFFIDAGADAVIAHHTHCFNGYEYYKNKPIAFGLGNFLFNTSQQNIDWSLGVIAILKIEKDYPIKIEFRPFLQNLDGLVFSNILTQKAKDYFNVRYKELEKVISDDDELRKRFDEFMNSKKKQYNHFIQPYSNVWLHRLFSAGIILSPWKNKKKLLLLNLIRCESHRDILIKLLDNENSHPSI